MPKHKARPVTVSAPQKGRSKAKGGIPLDELLAAHAAGRPAVATKKTPARASAPAKPPKTKPKKAPGRRLPRPDDAQVVQDGPPRLVGYARISTDDQTTALQADALARAAVDVVFEEEASGGQHRAPRARQNARRTPVGRYPRGVAARSARPVVGPSHRGCHGAARAGRLLTIADRRVRHLDGFRATLISRPSTTVL
jgi:hypothetical protein